MSTKYSSLFGSNLTDPVFSFDYNYQILDQTPPVGNYTLVNNTSNWLPLDGTPILQTGDISTDPEGYMFAVNTSADTSTIVWESNVPVCELTTYEITISFFPVSCLVFPAAYFDYANFACFENCVNGIS